VIILRSDKILRTISTDNNFSHNKKRDQQKHGHYIYFSPNSLTLPTEKIHILNYYLAKENMLHPTN